MQNYNSVLIWMFSWTDCAILLLHDHGMFFFLIRNVINWSNDIILTSHANEINTKISSEYYTVLGLNKLWGVGGHRKKGIYWRTTLNRIKYYRQQSTIKICINQPEWVKRAIPTMKPTGNHFKTLLNPFIWRVNSILRIKFNNTFTLM